MNKLKYIITLIASVSVLLFISSCDQEDPLTPETDKYVTFDRDGSVIPSRIQFSKDMIYFFRLSFDSNYLPEDSISVLAYFTSGTDTVSIDLYDDGIIDDSLRNDLAASNNIWSGGINAQSYPAEGDWRLNIESVNGENLIKEYEPVEGIRVRSNTAPDIVSVTGLNENDTLISGFKTRNIVVKVEDPDNDAAGYNDNQTLRLEIRNRDNIPKDYEFTRQNPLSDIVFQLDSTLAAGLKTNNRYNLTFIATDYYGESDSLKLDFIRIENLPPTIVSTEHPDTINTAEQGVFWIRSLINDPQGRLSYQDIERVMITINMLEYELLDDGDFITSGDETENDGLYSIGFSYNQGASGTFSFSITAYDKAGNISEIYQSAIVLSAKNSKNINTGNDNETYYNYIDPFKLK
ncbi:MAG: hypothetical protein PHF33_01645 [Candidatus Delongbacteria bacterium]|nr:hypothetical protein [Candidatus Delongbacteria bacterium]MDD4204566.1 hypothetical protein [Candidatus Delongbacteria bacterium]